MKKLVVISPADSVAVALAPIAQGDRIEVDGETLVAAQHIPPGHKIALRPIGGGEDVIKYACPIGHATRDIRRGEWVHTHNMATNLTNTPCYRYCGRPSSVPAMPPRSFMGYLRPDGRVASRNELWIIPTVGCVNSIAQHMTQENQGLVGGSIDGLYHFPHPYGCSQMGEDHARTRKLLAALARHPNAGGVLVLGLGCENNTMEDFKRELGDWDDRRVKFLVCQEVEEELDAGRQLLEQLARYAGKAQRRSIGINQLVVGLKCGGSDGLSGITANPVVGRFSDLLIAQGGSTVLSEVPEMFGAEALLLNRCADEGVYRRAVEMVEDFKQYFLDHGQVIYENPSPGNKEGGITTLEDKSCGCIQKGGSAPVVDVIGYGDGIRERGLTLLAGPGNDLVSATALTAAGAHLVLFTTGRGTPFGAPVPTIKVASNDELARNKRRWIDFDASCVAQGEGIDETGERLMDYVLAVASGTPTQSEKNRYREIAIAKDGVIL